MHSMTNELKAVDKQVGGFFLSTSRLWPLLCLLGLMLACHGKALLGSRQYGFRDAAHFYYPLNQRVQMEWDAGRWPLWEPEENGGMPLLGNPTAAVFYPIKIIFFLLPYAWAAKGYIVFHQVLCWFSMWRLARGIGLSTMAGWLASTTYAFGVPVLYQYCNVIFLIGAAWLPLGMLAGWRWIDQGSLRALCGLAVVIALQILGGDPQVGYLTLLCLFGLAFWNGLSDFGRIRLSKLLHPTSLLMILLLFTSGTILAAQFPMPPRTLRIGGIGTIERIAFSRSFWQLIGWSSVGLFFLNKWRKGWRRETMPRMFIGLGLATLLGAGMTAVQLIPVFEYSALSVRSAPEGPHDIYPFSVEPYRVLEFLWPHLFGVSATENRAWLNLLPPVNNHKQWVPSLYHGLPAFLLAISVFGFRGVDSRTKAISALLMISVIGAFGEFTGPLWILRRIPALEINNYVGKADESQVAALRLDGFPRDGDGGFYWLLAEIFPGFRTFRYPAKLLTFTSLCIGLLAGLAWDLRDDERLRKKLRFGTALVVIFSIAGLILMGVQLGPIKQWMNQHPVAQASIYGPLQTNKALLETAMSLVQSLIVALSVLLLIKRTDQFRWAIPLFCCLVCTDLAWSNSGHIRMVPQSLFEEPSKIVKLIEAAEADQPTPGGYYRVHRMPIWNPPGWNLQGSDDRVRDFVEWEHSTIQPKYGITQGVQYTITEGTTELYDYWWFFGPFFRKLTEQTAASLNAKAGDEVAYHPRRGFDMWNTRYFVVPGWPSDWKDDKRSFASFLFESEVIYPDPDLKTNTARKNEFENWAKQEDIQIFRNKAVYPRAWVVHEMRTYPTIVGMARRDRESVSSEMLYQNDPFWFDSGREVFDPKSLTWIDQADQNRVRPFMTGKVRPGSSEKVVIDTYDPQRVEMTAQLDKPGMVILADVFYSGWKLTVDGEPQEVVRANRMMRGALVPSGVHKLVYRYEPESFRIGGAISIASMTCIAIAFQVGRKRKLA